MGLGVPPPPKKKSYTPEPKYSLSLSLVAKSCLTLATSWTIAHQTPLSMGFPRQEYWSGLLFSSPRDLPDSRIRSGFPELQEDALLTEPPRKLIILKVINALKHRKDRNN